MPFQFLNKGRNASARNLPDRKSLSKTDRAMVVIAIAVTVALCALLVARVIEPEPMPGPCQLVTLAFVVFGALWLVRLAAIHKK